MAIMSDNSRRVDFDRASRKAQEAAIRRYEAVDWIERLLGPLGISSQPSELDFISCLRNGIILCNLINIIQPDTITKVVDNRVQIDSLWDLTPLPAFQYFENVRNFLRALQQLNLPAFDASDLHTDNFETGSAGRVADCILALKAYHEWKQWTGGKGVYKHVTVKSTLVKPFNTKAVQPACRPATDNTKSLTEAIVKVLSEHMVDSKENVDANFLTKLRKGNKDPVQLFSEILSSCLEEKLRNKLPAVNLKETLGKESASYPQPKFVLQEKSSVKSNSKQANAHSRKRRSYLKRSLQGQEKGLRDIKELWSETKKEFEVLNCQLMNDINTIGSLVKEMSNPARGYQKVIQENRKLYNMVQDLKGSIRVHCRIRPMFNADAKSVVSFCAEDGTLVVLDPSKPQAEGRKVYQFNHVYGPMATQDEVFKDAQPLVRSVMDGYNVCILAYGQTGSGKSYTMYGPSGVSEKEMGINFFALNGLFKTVGMRKNIINYELHLQMVEICNEQIRDLLAEVSACQDESSIPEVTSYAVKSNIEAINLVKQGEVRRIGQNSREETSLNNYSHSVVTIHVQGKDLSGNILRSRLHLVDLAGNGENNKSLSCLEDVITSLSEKHSSIHHRDSKLTSLLQDALGGKAKVLFFAHVIPEGDSFTKTVSTLNFAQKISSIELNAAQTIKVNSEVTELKNELLILKSALGEKIISSPQPCKQLKSPCDKARIVPQRTPLKSRRLSMENQGKLSKSPVGRQKIMTEATSPRSLRTSVENPSAKKTDIVRNAGYRRLSIENPVIVRSEKTLKSPNEGKKGVTKLTPPRTRRLSIDNKGTEASRRARRLSLEGPKDRTKEIVNPADVKDGSNSHISPTCQNGLTFIDCAEKFPPKTPEQPNHNLNHVIHTGVDILTDFQTPGTAKSTHGKGSQIKKSLRTIGKMINGSEKRNQNKLESTSTKVRDVANRAKSPLASKTRVVRRQSLTNIPPPGITRRSSLEGISTDTRSNGNRNTTTPPSVRSSTNTAKRWM